MERKKTTKKQACKLQLKYFPLSRLAGKEPTTLNPGRRRVTHTRPALRIPKPERLFLKSSGLIGMPRALDVGRESLVIYLGERQGLGKEAGEDGRF